MTILETGPPAMVAPQNVCSKEGRCATSDSQQPLYPVLEATHWCLRPLTRCSRMLRMLMTKFTATDLLHYYRREASFRVSPRGGSTDH